MVAGLSELVLRGEQSYIFESPTSPYIAIQPVELLFDTLRRFQTSGDIAAYGVDFIRAKVLLEGAIRDILQSKITPIFVFNGPRNDHVRFQVF